jgi:hypothetical protein
LHTHGPAKVGEQSSCQSCCSTDAEYHHGIGKPFGGFSRQRPVHQTNQKRKRCKPILPLDKDGLEDELEGPRGRSKNRPLLFVTEVLGATPEPWQAAALEA